jgi:uncharacterized protein with NAD-binding domain and iron-sulfur cluster
MPSRKKKIAILGGGVGAMACALELLNQAPDKFDVTVYQVGWRLGGKGASGRNSALGYRIEEHGPHLWFGCYANAFRLMQLAYKNANYNGTDLRQKFSESFIGRSHFTLAEKRNGHWISDWNLELPIRGVGHPDGVELSEAEIVASYGLELGNFLSYASAQVPIIGTFINSAVTSATATLGDLQLSALQLAIQAALYSPVGALSETARRLLILAELGVTTMKGILSDDISTRGFDSVNNEDLKDWLKRHGLHPASSWTPPLRMFYDMAFSYKKGDMSSNANAQFAAGVALRSILRIVAAYKEAPWYFMKGGMGDVVFAPFYIALKKLGVKFEFFSETLELNLSTDKKSIARVKILEQAMLKSPLVEYAPLIKVPNLPDQAYWPTEPLYDQINEGTALQGSVANHLNFEERTSPNSTQGWAEWSSLVHPKERLLERIIDEATASNPNMFDDVVLAISVGALAPITKELSDESAQWKSMLSMQTIATQNFQAWLTDDLTSLGAAHSGLNPIIASFEEPYSTICDFNQTLSVEAWEYRDSLGNILKPKSVLYAYSCSADGVGMPTATHVREWISKHWAEMFPNTKDIATNKVNFNAFFAPPLKVGDERANYIYARRNDYGASRYVSSMPGEISKRIETDKSGFENLFLAGDWTKNGLDVGAVESAATSGVLAAKALIKKHHF